MATYTNINSNRLSIVFLKRSYEILSDKLIQLKMLIGLKLCLIYGNANSRTCILKINKNLPLLLETAQKLD